MGEVNPVEQQMDALMEGTNNDEGSNDASTSRSVTPIPTEEESNSVDDNIFQASTQKRTVDIRQDSVDENPDAKKRKVSDESDDDGRLCSICLDNWTNTGDHRICALKCGHLFGHSCIIRWISSNKTCPSCKVKASKKDIRFIYANRLIAIDTSELDHLQSQLDKTVGEMFRIQIDLTKAICKEHMLMQELNECKEKIKILNTLNDGLSKSQSQKAGVNKLEKEIQLMQHVESYTVCPQGSCRVMDIHPRTGKFVVSLKSPNNVFQGYGIRKYNIENFALIAYTPLHSKAIRDLKFNHTNTSLLSVSLDKTARIIDINTNEVISTYLGDNMIWSCCWDATYPNIFYVGEQQGSISKFDIRNMNGPVENFKINNDMSPVVSLVSIPSYPGSVMPLGGFVACKLNSTWAFEKTSNDEYQKNLVPLDGPFSSMSYNNEFNQLLISARPNSREPNTRHIVCTLQKYNTLLKCDCVHTFCGGSLQKQLSRSCFVQNSKNLNTYVAAQKENSVVLWSVNNGDSCSALRTYSPVIDLMPLNNANGSHLLALSEKRFDLYKFCDS